MHGGTTVWITDPATGKKVKVGHNYAGRGVQRTKAGDATGRMTTYFRALGAPLKRSKAPKTKPMGT